jgi:hypothetical protein
MLSRSHWILKDLSHATLRYVFWAHSHPNFLNIEFILRDLLQKSTTILQKPMLKIGSN